MDSPSSGEGAGEAGSLTRNGSASRTETPSTSGDTPDEVGDGAGRSDARRGVGAGAANGITGGAAKPCASYSKPTGGKGDAKFTPLRAGLDHPSKRCTLPR